MREIILKIDEDNDIYEMIVNGKVYTHDKVYESEYSQLWDELNMSIECVQQNVQHSPLATVTNLIRHRSDNIYERKMINYERKKFNFKQNNN